VAGGYRHDPAALSPAKKTGTNFTGGDEIDTLHVSYMERTEFLTT